MINVLVLAGWLLLLILLWECIKKKKVRWQGSLSKEWTTVFKGIAIIIIIVSHVAGDSGTRFFTPLGGIGVSMFLILSGFGLSKSLKNKGTTGFWRKRLLGIYPVYLAVDLAAMIYYQVPATPLRIIYNLLLIDSAVPYTWYLRYLLYLYLGFYLANQYKKGKWNYILYGVFAIVSLLCFPQIMAEQSLSFWIGCYLADQEEAWSRVTHKRAVTLLCLLVSTGMLGIKQIPAVREQHWLVMNLIQLFIKLPAALFVLSVVSSFRLQLPCSFFYGMGAVSYELFLIHGMLLDWLYPGFPGTIILFLGIAAALSAGLHQVRTLRDPT